MGTSAMKKKTPRPRARPAAVKTADELNAAQQQAVRHGRSPLLIIAGAGTGKTLTLAHRVARLIEDGVPPERILLLTFTRRAAADMLHRVETLRGRKPAKKPRQDGDAAGPASPRKVWGGTFHAVGARLLRIHGPAIGVDPRFTIHDQADSTDLLDALRTELKLAEQRKEFPKKGTCQAVHSGWINSGTQAGGVPQGFLPLVSEGTRRLAAAVPGLRGTQATAERLRLRRSAAVLEQAPGRRGGGGGRPPAGSTASWSMSTRTPTPSRPRSSNSSARTAPA